MNEETFICDICGEEHAEAACTYWDDQCFCPTCLNTHPMSLTYHCRDIPWKDIMRAAIRMGYRCHQTDTCGLHVHVSRNAFGDTEEEQDAAIARLLYFFEKHWEELLKFSRRTAYQMEQWADRYGYKDRPKEILDHAKKG